MVRIRIGDEEVGLDWDEWERRVREGRVPPDALVRIEAVTGGQFVPAATLESYASLRADRAHTWQKGFDAAGPPVVTALLVGINLRIWWVARLEAPATWFDLWLSNWTAPILEDGEWWRPLTMGVLHLDLMHVAMNMLWFAYTGWNLERALGRANLALLYAASVLGGSLLSMFLTPESRSLGASGGVFGLVAASVVFGLTRPELLPARGRRVFGLALLPYLLAMFGSGLVNEGIDNWAHFGGLVTGGALALVLDPEPLQRRPWWNRAWRWGTLAAGAAILGTLVALGPRITPLAPHEVVEASVLARPRPRSPDAPRPPLAWSAPQGWRPGVTATGEAGFASPSPDGDRAWAVREQFWDRPKTTAQRADEWAARVRESFEGAVIDAPAEATLAGRPALTVRVRLPGDVEARWWGVARGKHGVEATWHVDVDAAERLTPLRDRLVASVRWDDPAPLADARALVERNPTSIPGRAALAALEAEYGDPSAALALYDAVIADDPEEPDWVVGRLQVLAAYPDAVADPEPLWAHAIAAHPTSEVVLAVAEALDGAGDPVTADGLYDLAWVREPGERAMRRARRSRGLPVAIDPATNLPREHVVEPTTGRPVDATAVAALRAATVDLATARAWGEARRVRRAVWTEEVRLALASDPAAALTPLLCLRDGAVPEDPVAGREALAEDLRSLERGATPKWVPPDLAAALAAPGTSDRVVETGL